MYSIGLYTANLKQLLNNLKVDKFYISDSDHILFSHNRNILLHIICTYVQFHYTSQHIPC